MNHTHTHTKSNNEKRHTIQKCTKNVQDLGYELADLKSSTCLLRRM